MWLDDKLLFRISRVRFLLDIVILGIFFNFMFFWGYDIVSCLF